MDAFTKSLLAISLLALGGCSKSETAPQVDNRFHIQGSWALYEIKQTTPTGTQVKQISTGGPVQGLTFLPSGGLAKQGDDLSALANWSFYQVDSTQAGLQLRLSTSPEASSGYYSVGLFIQDGKMVITPPCSEGCYFKLTRIYRTD